MPYAAATGLLADLLPTSLCAVESTLPSGLAIHSVRPHPYGDSDTGLRLTRRPQRRPARFFNGSVDSTALAVGRSAVESTLIIKPALLPEDGTGVE